MKESLQAKGELTILLRDARTGRIVERFTCTNLITDAGDLYYAQRGAEVAIPTNFVDGSGVFDGVAELWKSVSAAPGKANDRGDLTGGTAVSPTKAASSTYPKVNDSDADNTGKGADVITYKFEWTTGEANDGPIDDIIITNPTPGASEPLLCWADGLGAFTKTASQTLTVWVNHTITGV